MRIGMVCLAVSVAVALLPGTALGQAAPAGLVAAWGFEEGAGTSTADASGNGNNGAISAAAWTPLGRFGNALSFNGTSSLVRVAGSPSLNLTSAMTLSAWIRPTAPQSGWRTIIQRQVDAYLLHAGSADGPLRPAGGGTFAGSVDYVAGPTASPAGAWTHLAVTYDGAALRLYVNGTQVATRARTGTIETNNNPLWIGGNSPYGEHFPGLIDEVRVYNRALTQAAIQTDMNTPIAPAPDTTPPTAPTDLAATAAGTTRIDLTWTAATDDVAVTGYRVERCQGATCTDFAEVAAPTATSHSDTGLSPSTTYRYRVRAVDAAGNPGPYSAIVTRATPEPDTTPPPPPPPAGLLAGWAFDEGAGTTVADVSGHGNAATLRNDPTWTVGRYGSGLRFDGVDDFLTVLNSPSLNLSGSELTLSLWINPLGGVRDQVPFGKFWSGTMSSPFYQYGLELGGGNTPHFYVGTAGGPTMASMGSPLPLGQWSHLAIAFAGPQAQFYVNGSLVATRSLAASITARDSLLHMAADANTSQFFRGTLDDVRIYNRAQSQTDVRADMQTPLRAAVFDPTAPAVRITAPANDAIVSGNRTITADASDDGGVAGVQFYVDGNPLGPEDPDPPDAANGDTRAMANGAHTLTARARDTDDKTTLAAPVNVTVANSDHFQNQVLATGFTLPTNVEFLPDGRMLVAELAGTIHVLEPPYTTPDPTPFLRIGNIASGGVQQGIFDVALDPDFATNHYFYVFYTLGTPTVDRLARFTANAALTGTVPGSELVLYQDPGEAFIEHHGGAIAFGNDGKLYFTTGDHFAGTPSQDLRSPRGKVHRIDKDGFAPLDNPFHDGAGPNWDSVWAYGLRNPFRAYFDGPTNRLLIADVGGNVATSNEELNLGVAGANYGWPDNEGPCAAPCRSPLYDYEHNGGNGSITGGFVYHGTQFPSSMRGNYFFADYAQRWIRRLTFDSDGDVSGVFNFEPISGDPNESAGDIVDLTEGPDGALYYVDLGYSDISGSFGVSKIRRIRYLQSNQAPVAIASGAPTSGAQPLEVRFSSAGSRDPEGEPITYAWDFGDGTSSTTSNPTHTYTQAGRYVVRLTVSDGVNSSISTPLEINVGNAPTATIDSPGDGTRFQAGDVIGYSGRATDTEDGTLPAGAFTWTVDFLHDDHVHPTTVTSGVRSGTFGIPTSGHDFQGNTRYRIMLTVTDSDGLTDTESVIVSPQKVDLAFDTAPDGLTLYVDGVARAAPFVLDTLVGFNHTVEARDQSDYIFDSWSDGGAQSHTIVAPSTEQSYTAAFTPAG